MKNLIKLEYSQTDYWMSAIVKGKIKSVEEEYIMNGSTPYNVLGVQHTTCDFNMACSGTCKCDCTPSSRPDCT